MANTESWEGMLLGITLMVVGKTGVGGNRGLMSRKVLT